MAVLYADENVALELVRALRALGHDVLRALEDGRANQGIDDPDVLARAIEWGRAVLTNNRRDYHKLHGMDQNHFGIITYTDDRNFVGLAGRIDTAIAALASLAGELIKVIRPNSPSNP